MSTHSLGRSIYWIRFHGSAAHEVIIRRAARDAGGDRRITNRFSCD